MGKKERSEELFREYLSRRESGEGVDFEEYLRKFPELEGNLRKLLDRHRAEKTQLADLGPESGKPPHIIGDFRIIKEIGKGGMGTVYEAEQVSLKRKVALKILPSHLSFSDEAVLKFRREAEAGGRQSHPGIVSIHAVGEHEGVHYIAQELIESGNTIADKLDEIRKSGKQPAGYFREVAKLNVEIADALQHAHDAGVTHRDIKPSNILLTSDGTPKVTDFGLAKVEDALVLSRTGDFAGTPYYMSPEQAMSRRIPIDHRTDIYSLGVTFYEMLTLKRPFEGETSHEVLKKIILIEAIDPRKFKATIPRDLSAICIKAIEKNPDHRYQTMTQLADDLNRFLAGKAVSAKPIGIHQRLIRTVRRHPTRVTLATIAVIIMVSLSVIISDLYRSKLNLEEEKAIKDRLLKQIQQELKGRDIEIDYDFAAGDYNLVGSGYTSAEGDNNLIGSGYNSADEGFPKSQEKGISSQRDLLQKAVEAMTGDDLEPARQLTKEAADSFLSAPFDKNSIEQQKLIIHAANLLYQLGDLPYSRKLYEKILTESEQAGFKGEVEGELDLDPVKTNLAAVLGKLGDLHGALALQENYLSKIEKLHSPDHPEVQEARSNLAITLQSLGGLSEARALQEKVLEIRTRTLSPDNPMLTESQLDLASTLYHMGDYDNARILMEEAVRIQEQTLAPDSLDLQTSKLKLSYILNSLDKNERAKTLQEEVLQVYEKALPADHPGLQGARSALSISLRSLGDLDKAQDLSQVALDAFERTLPPDHPDSQIARSNLATILMEKGELTASNTLFEKNLEVYERTLPEDHPDYLNTLSNVAINNQLQGKYGRSEALYQKVLEAQEKVLGTEHPETISTLSRLGRLCLQREQYEKSESLLARVFNTSKKTFGLNHPRTKAAISDLITLYSVTNRQSEIEKYQKLLKD